MEVRGKQSLHPARTSINSRVAGYDENKRTFSRFRFRAHGNSPKYASQAHVDNQPQRSDDKSRGVDCKSCEAVVVSRRKQKTVFDGVEVLLGSIGEKEMTSVICTTVVPLSTTTVQRLRAIRSSHWHDQCKI